jgi:hypothetical protein
MIIANRPVAAEQRLEDLVAVGGVFQRQADVRIVIRRLVARYRAGGWYAPAGVELAAFGERGWL